MEYSRILQQLEVVHLIYSIRQHKSADTEININRKQNSINNIALNIGKQISDNNYGVISKIDKNAEMDII